MAEGLRYHAVAMERLIGDAGGSLLERMAKRVLRGPLDSTREVLKAAEAHAWDLELMVEDESYRRLPGMGAGDEIGDETLAKVRRKCRQWYRHNPIAGRWVNSTNDFVFGQGLTEPRAADPDVHALITRFWTNKQNRRVLTSYRAMKRLNTDLQLNGEVFLALFVNQHSGAVELGDIEPDEIGKIVCHPENRRLPLWYERSWQKPTKFDFKTGKADAEKTTFWYPDWQTRPSDLAFYGQPPGAQTAVVMHITMEIGGILRGLPLLWRALDWLKTHRGFLEDRATLTKARAFLSWIISQKGVTPKRMGSVLNSMQTDSEGRKIPPATGSMLRTHESVTVEAVETPRDAANAADEARSFLLMVSAAAGIPEPYFGDISRGGPITSTSLDLPTALRTESYRKLWTEVFDDIFQFCIDQAIEKRVLKDQTPPKERDRSQEAKDEAKRGGKVDAEAEPGATRTWRFVDIDFPPLAISAGVGPLVTAITDAADRGTFEEMEAAKTVMQLCGVDDATYKVKQLAAQKAERTAVAVQIAQGQGAGIPVDQQTRQEFPAGERTGVRSPDRKVGAPATKPLAQGAAATNMSPRSAEADDEWPEYERLEAVH